MQRSNADGAELFRVAEDESFGERVTILAVEMLLVVGFLGFLISFAFYGLQWIALLFSLPY